MAGAPSSVLLHHVGCRRYYRVEAASWYTAPVKAACSTAVIVLKPKPGQSGVEDVLRYSNVELRHEPTLGRLVLHKNETIIGTFADDEVARWYVEDE